MPRRVRLRLCAEASRPCGPPYAEDVTDQDMRAAALQYVRKISGFRAPAARNAAAFDAAVEEIAAATARLLESLEVHPHPTSTSTRASRNSIYVSL